MLYHGLLLHDCRSSAFSMVVNPMNFQRQRQTMANLLGPLGLQNRVPVILTRRRSVEVSEAAGPTNCTAVILSNHLYLMEQMVCIFRLQDDLTPLMTAALAGRYLSFP